MVGLNLPALSGGGGGWRYSVQLHIVLRVFCAVNYRPFELCEILTSGELIENTKSVNAEFLSGVAERVVDTLKKITNNG